MKDIGHGPLLPYVKTRFNWLCAWIAARAPERFAAARRGDGAFAQNIALKSRNGAKQEVWPTSQVPVSMCSVNECSATPVNGALRPSRQMRRLDPSRSSFQTWGYHAFCAISAAIRTETLP
jgi:hypothetical protein